MDIKENYYFKVDFNTKYTPYNKIDYVKIYKLENYISVIFDNISFNTESFNTIKDRDNKLKHYLNWVNKSLEIKEELNIF